VIVEAEDAAGITGLGIDDRITADREDSNPRANILQHAGQHLDRFPHPYRLRRDARLAAKLLEERDIPVPMLIDMTIQIFHGAQDLFSHVRPSITGNDLCSGRDEHPPAGTADAACQTRSDSTRVVHQGVD
jgi:hypothetical protein